MAPGEVGGESIIASGVGQAPDAFVWAVFFVDACLQRRFSL
jgi:hypothetical protein